MRRTQLDKKRKRSQNVKKRQNIQKVQRRSFRKLFKRSVKRLTKLSQFINTEDPKTLWSEKERRSIGYYIDEMIEDPRRRRGVRHQVKDVLILVLYALLCGKKTYVEIAAWLREREDIFTVLLGLEHGVPSASTISRIMKEISFDKLHDLFSLWCQEFIPIFSYKIGEDLQLHLCADGKAIRALTKKHIGKQHPPYMLNAYLYSPRLKAGFCIASLPIDTKTNEAKALVPFLQKFALNESIITVDAAGAYKETVAVILEAGAQALISLKDNQHLLKESARAEIKRAQQCLKEEKKAIQNFYDCTGYRQEPSQRFSSYKQEGRISHGRYEKRDYVFTNDLVCIDKQAWPQIKGIGRVQRLRKTVGYEGDELIVSGESQPEDHFYLSTCELTARQFSQLVSRHWFIESRLHGILDSPAFDEDHSRMRVGQAMQNMALLRRLAYDLLELLYLHLDPQERPSFPVRMIQINEDDLAIEKILFKSEKAASLDSRAKQQPNQKIEYYCI